MLTTLATQLFRTDLTDPTSDGILTKAVNFGISALMVLVVVMGAWYAFSAWTSAKGKGDSAGMTALRNVVFGVIVIEAVLGGILLLANYGTNLLPSLGIA
jgi:hypothetical protein